MFEFDYTKLIAIGVIALLVIGPKELPGLLRQVGQYIAKMRRMAADFQQQFSEAMRESELQELKKDMEKMAQDAKVELNYDMVRETEREIREAVENSGKPVEAAKAAEIRNPTPDNDPDGAFINVEIPKDPVQSTAPASAGGQSGGQPVATMAHPPVREVGLEPEPVEAAPKARLA